MFIRCHLQDRCVSFNLWRTVFCFVLEISNIGLKVCINVHCTGTSPFLFDEHKTYEREPQGIRTYFCTYGHLSALPIRRGMYRLTGNLLAPPHPLHPIRGILLHIPRGSLVYMGDIFLQIGTLETPSACITLRQGVSKRCRLRPRIRVQMLGDGGKGGLRGLIE